MSWVGGTLLEAQSTPDHGVAESEFLDDWKNQLPEMWRNYVALSTLKVLHSHSYSIPIICSPYYFLVQILSPIEREDQVRHRFRGSFGFRDGYEHKWQTTREVARKIQEHKAIVWGMFGITPKMVGCMFFQHQLNFSFVIHFTAFGSTPCHLKLVMLSFSRSIIRADG